MISAEAGRMAGRSGSRPDSTIPLAGSHVIERHARPGSGVHALQIEIDRRRYLDAELRKPGASFDKVAGLIEGLAVEAGQSLLSHQYATSSRVNEADGTGGGPAADQGSRLPLLHLAPATRRASRSIRGKKVREDQRRHTRSWLTFLMLHHREDSALFLLRRPSGSTMTTSCSKPSGLIAASPSISRCVF